VPSMPKLARSGRPNAARARGAASSRLSGTRAVPPRRRHDHGHFSVNIPDK